MTERDLVRPLAWARIAFATVILIRTTPLLRALDPGLGRGIDPLLGWPSTGVVHAGAFGLTLPPTAVAILCIARTMAAILLLVGYRPALAGPATFVAGYAVMLQDVFGFNFTQHLLFVGAAVIGITDCDAVLALRHRRPSSPRTSFLLLRAFVTSIYFWAACAKLRRDWFDGRTLGLFYEEGKLRGELADLLFATAARRATAATAVALTELALVVLLWVPKLRRVGLVMAVGLHLTIELIAHPDVLGWAMISLLSGLVPLGVASSRAVRRAARRPASTGLATS